MRSLVMFAALSLGCARPVAPPRAPASAPRGPHALSPVAGHGPPEGAASFTLLADDTRAAVLRDGAAAILHADGRALMRLDLGAPAACALVPWGLRAFALCDGDEGATRPNLAADPPRLSRWQGPARRFIASRDGRTLTLRGPCAADADDASRDPQAVACTLTTGRPWREWRADVPGDVVDVYGDVALIRRLVGAPATPNEPGLYDVGLYEIDLARWHPIELSDPTARWIRAGFDRHGDLLGVVHTGDRASPRAWRVNASLRAPARMTALPFPVDDLDTIEPHTTVAVGERGSFLTDDDGATFHPVHASDTVTGSPTRTPGHDAARPARVASRVICQRAACVIDGRVLVSLDSSSMPGFP